MNTTKKALARVPRAIIVAAIATAGITSVAFGQPASGPLDPGTTLAQGMPPSAPEDGMGSNRGAPPSQPGAMPQGMDRGMMHGGMMGGGMMGGPSGAMPTQSPMMKIMIAVIDADGDGALSFEELSIIHKRVFDRVDANKDGKVTLEEAQLFIRT
jgi:hypothetical protein